MPSLRAVLAALATMLALSAFAQPAPLTGDLAEIFAAAERGDPEAQFYYAKRYYFGRGLPQDYEKAATWFLRSADQGYPDAQWYIAEMYMAIHWCITKADGACGALASVGRARF